MQDHKRIFRIFQLISRLKSPIGVDKTQVAADFEVSVRTIERYIELLQHIGFHIESTGSRFKIKVLEKVINPHDLVVFSVEEAATVRDAMLNASGTGPFRKSVLEKLYALTDMDQVSDALHHQQVSRNLSTIRTCIREKQRVYLLDYQSVNSNTITNRMVEPIRFFDYYKYLLAFEEESGEVRQFKIDRIGGVKSTNKPWRCEHLHVVSTIDVFGMTGDSPIHVVIDLSLRAQRLMVEEFPEAQPFIQPISDKFRFSASVNGLDAVGRFAGGLIGEIVVLEPTELIEHLNKKFEIFHQRHYLS